MTHPREATPGNPAGHRAVHKTVLALTLLFVLAAALVSIALLVYTAWRQDLENGLFALAFAVLSARAVLSWVSWSYQPFSSHQRKPADETIR